MAEGDKEPERLPPALAVELLSTVPMVMDASAFETAARRRLPGSRLVNGGPSAVMVAHDDVRVTMGDESVAILTAVFRSGTYPETAIDASQSHGVSDAAMLANTRVDRCLVTETMGAAADRRDRVRAFHAGLCAAIDALHPSAVWSANAQRLCRPEVVLANPLEALVNVRYYPMDMPVTLPGGRKSEVPSGVLPGAIKMDTRGLYQFKLPDVQCLFRRLEPVKVAGLLYAMVGRMFAEGDVFEEGHAVEGVDGTGPWRCTRDDRPRTGPRRRIVDLVPDEKHRAEAPPKQPRWWKKLGPT